MLVHSCSSSVALRALAQRERCRREHEMAQGNIMAADWGVGVECNDASSSEPTHTWQAQMGKVAHVTARGFELWESFGACVFYCIFFILKAHSTLKIRCWGALGCWSAGEEGREAAKMFFTAAGKVELRGRYSFLFPSFKFEMKLFYSIGRVFFEIGSGRSN